MMAPSSSLLPGVDGIARSTSVSRGEVVLAPLSIGHMSRESGAGRRGPPGHAGPAAFAFGSVASPPVNMLRVAHQSTICIIPVIFVPRSEGARKPPFKKAQTRVCESQGTQMSSWLTVDCGKETHPALKILQREERNRTNTSIRKYRQRTCTEYQIIQTYLRSRVPYFLLT